MTDAPSYLHRPGKPDIACKHRTGTGPGILWLSGFGSTMDGTKAAFLDNWAKENGRAFTRFDYTGHGASGGAFEKTGITDWAEDALAVLDEVTNGPQILVGSSMGGWIACLLAKWRPESLAGMVLLAPAADFTSELRWPSLTAQQQRQVMEQGKVEIPSPFEEGPTVYTKLLFDQGQTCRVLDEPLPIPVPVRILHGLKDNVIPTDHVLRLADHIDQDDIIMTLIKSGDHRLSSFNCLKALETILADTPNTSL